MKLTSNGKVVDESPEAFGSFRDSTSYVGDAEGLRSRLAEDGYLLLRQMLDPEMLGGARDVVVKKLRERDLIDLNVELPGRNLTARPGVDLHAVMASLNQHEKIQQIASNEKLLTIFSDIFGEAPAALDYVWPRISGPGKSSTPHSDWVYMCRGTKKLFTTWIPFTDVPRSLGSLMVLENSHIENMHTHQYLNMDADKLGILNGLRMKHGQLVWGGHYSFRPDKVQKEFGTRWLSEDFKLGDMLILDVRGLHSTFDNQTDQYRLSVDLRFQPATEPRDSRFVGPNPVGHANKAKSVRYYWSRLRGIFSSAEPNEFSSY